MVSLIFLGGSAVLMSFCSRNHPVCALISSLSEFSRTKSWHTEGQKVQKVLPSCVLRSSAANTLQNGIHDRMRLIASAACGDSEVSFILPLCRSENLDVNLKSMVNSPDLARAKKFFIMSLLRASPSSRVMGL